MDRIEVKFAADQVDEKTGEFSGYGAVFGNVDSHGDIIAPGAFTETLAVWGQKGRLPPMRLMHGTALNPFSGSDLPIGIWTKMAEDAVGLRVEGKISGISTDRGRYTHALVKDGALAGLSIGYRTVKATPAPKGSQFRRTLDVIALGEISLVDDPSNSRSWVDAVKAADEITSIREFEAFLRDVGGFSHAAAKRIAAGGFKGSDPRDEDGTDIAAALRRNIGILKGN